MHFTESCHDNLAWEVFQAKMHLKWDNWETELCFCGRAMLLCRQCCLEWKILWRLSKLSVSFLSPLLGFSRSMGGFFLLSTLFTNGSLSEPSALVPPCHVANWGWDIALMCWTRFTRIAEARHTQQTCGLVENIVCMLFMLLYLHHCISKKWERKKRFPCGYLNNKNLSIIHLCHYSYPPLHALPRGSTWFFRDGCVAGIPKCVNSTTYRIISSVPALLIEFIATWCMRYVSRLQFILVDVSFIWKQQCWQIWLCN